MAQFQGECLQRSQGGRARSSRGREQKTNTRRAGAWLAFPISCSPGSLTRGVFLPTIKTYLRTLINFIKTIPHRHFQRLN